MIRFPKRQTATRAGIPEAQPSSQELEDADIVPEEDSEDEAVATRQVRAVDAEAAAKALTAREAVPVGLVMASLEAEISRAMTDEKAAWTRSSAPPPPPASVPALLVPAASAVPVSLAPTPASPAPTPVSPAPTPVSLAPTPVSPPPTPVSPAPAAPAPPSVVVVRERPAFSWIIACLALGALAAVVGMRVASGLSARPPAAPAASVAPPAAISAAVASGTDAGAPTTGPTPSGSVAAVVAFEDKDAVRVARPRPPAPATEPAPSGSAVAASAPSSSAPPRPSARADGPPPLVPDQPAVVPPPPPPPPPPPKPARPKTPQELLQEAQLKAASQ